MNIVSSYLADKESAWSPLHYRNVSRTLRRLVEDLDGAARIAAHLEPCRCR